MLEAKLAAFRQTGAEPGMSQQQGLYRLLKGAILEGALPPDCRLPPSRQLAADYGWARNSVLYAYQQLQAEGFIVADRQGSRVAALVVPGNDAPGEGRGAVHGLSLRAEGLQAQRHDEALLPFAPGVADLNCFPWGSWARQLQRAWGEVTARQVAYAEVGGAPALRAALAAYLRVKRGVSCSAEQVFVVGGAQVAIDACARLLADSGDTVWLENPCYHSARLAMQAAGLKLVNVPVDRDGMAPADALWHQQPPRLMYLTPSHQYPLGAVLSLERRLAFLQRAAAIGAWIIEDDYDSEFNHLRPGQALPSMQGLQPDGPVIYIGTFSKLLYPGLRVAYMVVPRWLADRFGEALACVYRGGQAVEQRALARFIDTGALTRHWRRMAPLYRARQAVLRDALRTAFGDRPVWGGRAGLHLTLPLPEGPPDTAIVAAASALGVTVRALSGYYAPDADQVPINGLVLGYGMAEESRIPELVHRVRQAHDKVLDAVHHAPRE